MSDKLLPKKKSGLGGSPLSLFSPTTSPGETQLEHSAAAPEPSLAEIEQPQKSTSARSSKSESIPDREFLRGIEGYEKESIGLQVTAEINDWLDEVVKAGRRNFGKKIPKQVWIQASIELLRAMPIDWGTVGDLDELREKLTELSAIVKANSG